MKIIQKSITCLLLLFFVFMGSGVTEGFVLCFGSDGHRAVEPPHSGLLGSSSNWPLQAVSPALSMPVTSSSKKHDVPCMDFPISIGSLDMEGTLYKNLSAFTFPFDFDAISDNAASQADRIGKKPFPSSLSTVKAPLSSLRSVILLI